MVINAALDRVLDQLVTVFRPTETVTRGYTDITLSSTLIGSIKSHIQPLTPQEVQREWGVEISGDYQAFLNSTVDVQVGDLIKQTSGPSPSTPQEKRFWVRGLQPFDTSYAAHTMALLERTSEFSTI